MPPVIIAAAVAAASAAAAASMAALATTAIVAIAVAAAAVTALVTYQAMKQTVPKFNSPDSASTIGTSTDPKSVVPVVYGNSRVGAICVYKDVKGTGKVKDDMFLVSIYAISLGQIDSFKNLYLDNKKILADGVYRDGVVSSNNILSNYRDVVQVEFSVGSQNGRHLTLASQYLGTDKWPLTNTGNGIATMCVVLKKTQDALTSGVDILQPNSQVAVDLSGTLITDLTNGTRWASTNGASQAVDYLTNTNYGLGVPLENIDLDSFKAVAVQTSSFYSHGSTDPNNSFKSNLSDLCLGFGGVIFESFGKLVCKLDGPDVVKYSFDESNILASSVEYTDGSTTDYFNTLNVAFNDPNADYAQNILRYPSDPNSDPVIAKDGRIIAKDVTYRFVKDTAQLDKLSSIERNKCKLTQTLSFATADAYTLQVWDVIKFSNDELQLKDALFRVTSITRTMESGMAGSLQVTAVEYNSQIYTDMDYAVKPDNTGSSISTNLKKPYNFKAMATGETVYGKNVLLTWDCDHDFNRYQFFVQYKESGSTYWTSIGSTSQYSFTITGLKTGVNYDYRVCAAGLYYQSDWVTINNQNPDVTYTLPAPNVKLRNATTNGGLITTDTDFFFEWDDQSTLDVDVNGVKQKFVDVFDKYQIRVTANNTTYTYFTNNISWAYTFGMNQSNTLSREIKIGVSAVGFGGMKSTETVLTVKNEQHKPLKGFVASAGYGSIFTRWIDSDETDYAGVIIQTATDANFTQNLQIHQSRNAIELATIHLSDGSYYVRGGAFDQFGIDGVVYGAAQHIDLQSHVDWTAQDKDALEDFLNLEAQFEDMAAKTLQQANDALQVEIGNLHTNITNDYKRDIAASVTDLKSIVQDGDALVTSKLDQVKTDAENGLAAAVTDLTKAINDGDTAQGTALQTVKSGLEGKITAEVNTLNQTITTKDTAQGTALQQVKSNVEGQIATVTQQSKTLVDNLTNKINANYTLKLDANGVVTGMQMIADSASGKSAVYFNAKEFMIISDPTNTAAPVIPFAVQNNKVFINTAVIADGSIGNAKIGDASINTAKIVDGSITSAKIGNAQIGSAQIANLINSNDWDGTGNTGWGIFRDGRAYFNNIYARGHIEAASGSFTGNVNANSGYFAGELRAGSGYMNNIDIGANCRIHGTLTANQIEGDVTKGYALTNNVTQTIPAMPFNRMVVVPTITVKAMGQTGAESDKSASSSLTLYVNGVAVASAGANSSGSYSDVDTTQYSFVLPAGQSATLRISGSSRGTNGVTTPFAGSVMALVFKS